jgi:cytochrome P450 family 6
MFHLLLNCSEHFERYLAEMVPADKIVECRDLTAKFTVDVIGSCAFGIEMNAMNEETNQFCLMGRKIFRSDIKVLIRSIIRETSFFKYFGYLFDDHDVTQFMTNITRNTIEYRKKNNVSRHDFVDTLIYLKDHPEKLGTNGTRDIKLSPRFNICHASRARSVFDIRIFRRSPFYCEIKTFAPNSLMHQIVRVFFTCSQSPDSICPYPLIALS